MGGGWGQHGNNNIEKQKNANYLSQLNIKTKKVRGASLMC